MRRRRNTFFLSILISVAILALVFLFQAPTVLAAVCCKCTDSNAADPKATICINTAQADCGQIKSNKNNLDLANLDCDLKALETAQCVLQGKAGQAGGLCVKGPTEELSYVTEGKKSGADTGTATGKPITPPVLNIPIPNLQFSTAVVERNNELEIPFLAQYLSAIYKYLIGISVVAAAIMLMYGGFLYIMAAGGKNVQTAKDIIKNALLGLLLLFGTYTILNTINPATINPAAIKIKTVRPQIITIPDFDYQKAQHLAHASGNAVDPDIVAALQANPGGTRPKGTDPYPDTPFDKRTKISKGDMEKILDALAQKNNFDPCILKAIFATESNYNNAAVGHDENSAKITLTIQPRLDFLRGGKFYSGKPLGIDPPLPEKCGQDNANVCLSVLRNNSRLINDDHTFKPDDLPLMGLDWRFSHGIGSGQCTIFGPGTKDANGRPQPTCTDARGLPGRPLGGKCFTVPMLMTNEFQLECMVTLLIAAGRDKTPCVIFNSYAGSHDKECKTEQIMKDKMAAYDACKKAQPKVGEGIFAM